MEMNEEDFQDIIEKAIDHELFEFGRFCQIETFEDAGILTMNKGLVVRLHDGSEFQITIVQSKTTRLKFNEHLDLNDF